MKAADDPLVAALRDSGAGVVTLVAKSHDRHVELALRTTLEENLAMIRDTVTHLRAEGQQVFLDAEHFFDGYRDNRDYALEVLRTAYDAGAAVIALCDTNGGMLPGWVADVVHDVVESTGVRVGIHCHNDTGCAVANTLAAVDAGATHVQGTINGYGERTGNADLVSVVANLELKLDRRVLPPGLLATPPGSRTPSPRSPTSRPHRASRTSAPRRSRTRPACTRARSRSTRTSTSTSTRCSVGNDMRLLVSDMAGRASIELKGRELGFDLAGDKELVSRVTERVKELESSGYTFEAADASFELLLVEEVEGARPAYFEVESWRVITETTPGDEAVSEATVKLRADGVRYVVTGEGNGPVNALDQALREAIGQAYPEVAKFELIDYKVRILDQGHGTDAITRVLIETTDGESSWVTVGVGAQRDRGVVGGAGRRRHLRAASPPPGLRARRTAPRRRATGDGRTGCAAPAGWPRRPRIPVTTKIRARPRSAPVPNQGPTSRHPQPSVMNGITMNCAIGPIRNAVSGEAACSTLWAKPKTRPCRSNGTTFCSTVCSAASANGISSMNTAMPAASSTIELRIGNSAVTVHSTRLTSSSVRTGLLPRPTRATTRPPTITNALSTPQSRPQTWTDTSDRP